MESQNVNVPDKPVCLPCPRPHGHLLQPDLSFSPADTDGNTQVFTIFFELYQLPGLPLSFLPCVGLHVIPSIVPDMITIRDGWRLLTLSSVLNQEKNHFYCRTKQGMSSDYSTHEMFDARSSVKGKASRRALPCLPHKGEPITQSALDGATESTGSYKSVLL